MVSYKLISINHKMSFIGAYLPLSTLDHLLDLEEEMNRFPGRDSVVLGDLNVDIRCLRNPRDQQVAYFQYYFRLVDVLVHF